MRYFIMTLIFLLILPCFCEAASMEDEFTKMLQYLASDEQYDFVVYHDAPCAQLEALLIIGSVGIMRDCILFPKPDSCSLNQVAVMISFCFYYPECQLRKLIMESPEQGVGYEESNFWSHGGSDCNTVDGIL